jgi:carbon storage regulator
MLVLSRKAGQRVLIGGNVSITVVRIRGRSVRIGIEAPPELPIVREELLDKFGLMRDSIAGILAASSNCHGPNGDGRLQNRHRARLPAR